MFNVFTLEKLKNDIDKIKIGKLKNKYIFFPIQYLIIFLFMISIYLIKNKENKILFYLLLFMLIFSYLYTVYKNRIVIDLEKIITKNKNIYFLDIEKIILKRLKIGKKVEVFLCIVTKDKIENQIRISYILFYRKMIKIILERTNLEVKIEN